MDNSRLLHVYSPLTQSKKEVRLVRIEPHHHSVSPNPILRCTLETVSLLDLVDQYHSFVESEEPKGLSLRQITARWSQHHRPRACGGDAPPGSAADAAAANPSPEPNAYRFRWGDYAALSYVWGSESSRRNIAVNGQRVSVTTNLELALRAMAEKNTFGGGYRLWVDAICIDQTNEEERASQIPMMREIYSTAWSVIAWLGSEGDESDRAFHLLRSLASLPEEEMARLGNILDANPEYFGRGCFFALHELMERDYWSRLWIVQEVILGASSTMLHCGDQVLDWTTFCAALAVLYRAGSRMWAVKNSLLRKELDERHDSRRDRRWQPTRLHMVFQDLRPLSRREDHGGQRLGLRRLLEMSISSSCRDTRDKVYALVGMMEPQIAGEVIRAYVLPTPTLFATVAKAFIDHDANLEALRQGNPWGPQKGPTWAADWTWRGRLRWSRPETVMMSPLWNSSDPGPPPEAIYNACNGLPARYSFSPTGDVLTCQGFVFDEIAGLGTPEADHLYWCKDGAVQFLEWESSYGDDAATAKALYSAILLGRVRNGERIQDRHTAAISGLPSTWKDASTQFESRGWDWLLSQKDYYPRWIVWRLVHNNLVVGRRPLGSYFTNTIPEGADKSTVIEVYCAVDRTLKERRFMLTRNGYLGWAPDNAFDEDKMNAARPGDLIAVVLGCSTPLVIRSCGAHFQVIGEAYVEAFMDGEAVRFLESGRCPLQSFDFV